jgi:REP element-mobilizing transposase RayT
MARATRVDFPGAWYHVLNRGTERRAIFRSTRCYEKFIQLLSSLPERFGIRLHGYALMGNHYHLQLESREANLSKSKIPSSRTTVSGTFQSHPPRANRSAEDQPLHSFESGTDCRPGRTRDSRRRRPRDNCAISPTSGGRFGTIPLEFLRFLRWNPSSTRLAIHRVHLGVLRSRLAMRAPKGVSSAGSMTIFAGGSLTLPSGINRGVPTNVRCVLCHSGHCVQHVGSDLQRRRAFRVCILQIRHIFPPMRSPNRLFGRRGECRRILPDELLHAHRPLPR